MADTTALARRFKVDVTGDLTLAGGFIPLKAVTDLNPKIAPNNQSADDYDTDGWQSFEKTQQGWTLTAKVLRKTNAGVFDAGQELVRSRQLGWDDNARVGVRWYDRNGAPEAYQGVALVSWEPSKTGVADLDEVTVTLTGTGELDEIENPATPSSDPVISSVTPTGAASGTAVAIYGTGFNGVTGAGSVTFGGVNAESYSVQSDGLILAVLPTGAAGAAPVIVTNAVGASQAFGYTRAA